MHVLFAENLRKFRIAKGLSQQKLAEKIYVTRSTVARWESGSRLPDAMIISRLAQCLETDVNTLISAVLESDEAPKVIMVDDRKIFLSGALPILEVEYAKANLIALAFLDIEMGMDKTNGLDLCRKLLEINPRTNVVYLTAYIEYSFDAWSTGASGFTLKPITAEGVRA